VFGNKASFSKTTQYKWQVRSVSYRFDKQEVKKGGVNFVIREC